MGDRRFPRLVVGRERTITEPARHEQPPPAVGHHDERLAAGVRIDTRAVGHRRSIRSLADGKIRYVVAGPCLALRVPPDVALALAPWFAVRIGGGAVVENAAVGRPRVAPVQAYPVITLAVASAVATLLRIDSAVDPAATRGGPIVLERGEAWYQLAVGDSPAVDLAHDIFHSRLVQRSLGRVVPGQRLESAVAWVGAVGVEFLETAAEMVDEPCLGARITRRIGGLVVPLNQAHGIGERSRSEEHMSELQSH